MLMSIEKNLNQSENEKMKAESYRLEAEKLKKELEEQKRKLAENRERLIQEARAEARKILLEARKEAEEIISKMRRLEQEVHNAQRQKEAEELRLKLKRKVDSIEETLELPLAPKNALVKPPENLKPGDSVLIVNLDQKGTVITPPDKDGEVVVQAGIMKINVHISNLKLVDEQKIVLNNSGIGKNRYVKSKSISTEIDVRGYNLEEAIESVDKYLDDAYLSGLTEVSIIHGKGTGVLRMAYRNF